MIVGLCAMMINSFRITSNRESGNGRYDVQMLPLTKHFPGFLIEIKAEKDCSEEQLEALAQTALQQINDRSYSAELQALGIKSLLNTGLRSPARAHASPPKSKLLNKPFYSADCLTPEAVC